MSAAMYLLFLEVEWNKFYLYYMKWMSDCNLFLKVFFGFPSLPIPIVSGPCGPGEGRHKTRDVRPVRFQFGQTRSRLYDRFNGKKPGGFPRHQGL